MKLNKGTFKLIRSNTTKCWPNSMLSLKLRGKLRPLLDKLKQSDTQNLRDKPKQLPLPMLKKKLKMNKLDKRWHLNKPEISLTGK